jgi:hypothetical protein
METTMRRSTSPKPAGRGSVDRPTVVLRLKERIALRLPPRSYRRRRGLDISVRRLIQGFAAQDPALEGRDPQRIQVGWDEAREAWTVSRDYAEYLIRGLADAFGEVVVFQYGDPAVLCNASCQQARRSRAYCECSCAGAGHRIERRPSQAEVADARTHTAHDARKGMAGVYAESASYTVTETAEPRQTPEGIVRRYVVRPGADPERHAVHNAARSAAYVSAVRAREDAREAQAALKAQEAVA